MSLFIAEYVLVFPGRSTINNTAKANNSKTICNSFFLHFLSHIYQLNTPHIILIISSFNLQIVRYARKICCVAATVVGGNLSFTKFQ